MKKFYPWFLALVGVFMAGNGLYIKFTNTDDQTKRVSGDVFIVGGLIVLVLGGMIAVSTSEK